MLRLNTTTRKLQVSLDGAVTSNQLPVVVSYSDKTESAYNGGANLANTNGVSLVDICPAPAASTVRDIDSINIYNRDTVAATVSVIYNDNATTYVLLKATLAVGDQLIYTHGQGWKVIDSTGAAKNILGAVDAMAVANAPAGSISSTTVQGAINELDTDKAPISSPTFTGTVWGITKTMVGLGNINNTSDENKPISTATQTALNAKANTGSANTFTAQQSFTGTTAAAPAIAGASDPNTGVFFPAADTVAVSTGGAERMRIDTSGNVLVTNPSGGLGYGPGAGGTVTQETSKSTSVTLNKPYGRITMHNAALAAGDSILFQVANSLVSGIDTVIANVAGYATYSADVLYVTSGNVAVRVTNTSGGSLSEAVLINFAIIKGSIS